MGFPLTPLVELNPQWLHADPDNPRRSRHVFIWLHANGIMFKCPKCYHIAERTFVGVHSIMCWDPSVPLDEWRVGPGRWNLSGETYDSLSLVAGSSSVHLSGPGCGAHFFIERGIVRDC